VAFLAAAAPGLNSNPPAKTRFAAASPPAVLKKGSGTPTLKKNGGKFFILAFLKKRIHAKNSALSFLAALRAGGLLPQPDVRFKPVEIEGI
jgi:hypothetical protein